MCEENVSEQKNKLLERQLNDVRLKNAELEKRLEYKIEPGECKSGLCIICENFMGFVEDRLVCKLFE